MGANTTVNAIIVFFQIFLGIFQIVVRLAFVLLRLGCDAGNSLLFLNGSREFYLFFRDHAGNFRGNAVPEIADCPALRLVCVTLR